MADGFESGVNATSNNSSHARETLLVYTELKPLFNYMIIICLLVIMLSMGCEMTWQKLSASLRRPIGIGIGMASQFGILPLSAYTLLRAISISNLYATAVLIISCCPGGVLSNVIAYYCDGDVSLSVAMTSVSTLLATGMMPLNLWLYGRSFESEDLVIPYAKMAISLLFVTCPVAMAMLIRWRYPKVARYVTKIGSFLGVTLFLGCSILQVLMFNKVFERMPAGLYACVLGLHLVGLALGFGLASLFRQDMAVRKTIAIECGVQNVPTALAIITLSFTPEMQEDILLIPFLYGFATTVVCAMCCITYNAYKWFKARSFPGEDYIAVKPVVTNDANVDVSH